MCGRTPSCGEFATSGSLSLSLSTTTHASCVGFLGMKFGLEDAGSSSGSDAESPLPPTPRTRSVPLSSSSSNPHTLTIVCTAVSGRANPLRRTTRLLQRRPCWPQRRADKGRATTTCPSTPPRFTSSGHPTSNRQNEDAGDRTPSLIQTDNPPPNPAQVELQPMCLPTVQTTLTTTRTRRLSIRETTSIMISTR